MNLVTPPTHRPPVQSTRRPYTSPQLEPLGAVAQVTAGMKTGGTPDNKGSGASGS